MVIVFAKVFAFGCETSVLKGDAVTVNSDVTKEMLTAKDFANPTLTFKAYAVQKDNVASASDAWAKVNP